MRKRYSDAEKKKILDYVETYNQKNGRGGQAAAVKKFGINVNSIRNWSGAASKPKKKKAPAKKQTRQVAARARSNGATPVKKSASNRVGVLNQMVKIQQEIESLNAEFQSLKAKL